GSEMELFLILTIYLCKCCRKDPNDNRESVFCDVNPSQISHKIERWAMSVDQAISVPPPVHIAPIWSIADNVFASIAPDTIVEAKAPVSGSLENPALSRSVIIPISNMAKAETNVCCST